MLPETDFLFCLALPRMSSCTAVLLPANFKPRVLQIACHMMVLSVAILEGGWADSPAASVCWHQEVFWRHGWDVTLYDFVMSGESLLFSAVFQRWQVQFLEHTTHVPRLSGLVVLLDESDRLALHPLQSVHVLLQVWIPHRCAIFQRGPDRCDIRQATTPLGAVS